MKPLKLFLIFRCTLPLILVGVSSVSSAPYPISSNCSNGTELLGSGQIEYSPDLPNYECVWYLTAGGGQKLLVRFDFLQLEPNVPCRYDWVEVREGHSVSGPSLGEFCRSPPDLIRHGDDRLTIIFRSGSGHSLRGRGFLLTFESYGEYLEPQKLEVSRTEDQSSWPIESAEETEVTTTIDIIQTDSSVDEVASEDTGLSTVVPQTDDKTNKTSSQVNCQTLSENNLVNAAKNVASFHVIKSPDSKFELELSLPYK